MLAEEYLKAGYSKVLVLGEFGVSRSGYYKNKKRAKLSQGEVVKKKLGRPFSNYSLNKNGERVCDVVVRGILRGYRQKEEFSNWGGYKVLTRYLSRDYGLRVNAKKVYRLCREEKILLPQFKRKRRKQERVCMNRRINGPNQLWEFDIKQGCIHGENKAFYLLAFIDVFSREIVSCHIGLSCRCVHLRMALDEGLKKQGIGTDNRLVIRSDNGSQMTSHEFRKHVEKRGLYHEFTPFSCPEKNAYVESFFSLYEIEFLQTRYFRDFKEAYTGTLNYIDFYHKHRLHGSLFYLPPHEFKEKQKKGFFKDFCVSV